MSILPKLIAFLLVGFIMFSLFRGLYFLVKGHKKDNSAVARSLTYRVAFSACLLIFLVVSGYMGWIEPHRVNPTQKMPFHGPSYVEGSQSDASVDGQH